MNKLTRVKGGIQRNSEGDGFVQKSLPIVCFDYSGFYSDHVVSPLGRQNR